MTRLAKIQLIGPLTLFVAVMGAEGATWALVQSPSSEILWFINLQVFGLFQKCHYFLSSHVHIPYFQFFIALSLFVIAFSGLVFKNRFFLPLASNLSFTYVGFAAYAWYLVGSPSHAASLADQTYQPAMMTLPSGPDLWMFLVLLGASLLSFVASHVFYIRAVRAGH